MRLSTLLFCIFSTGIAGASLAESPTDGKPVDEALETISLHFGETFSMHSSVLDEQRVINVVRPPGVEEGVALPILYMLDGGVEEDLFHIAGLVRISVINGTMRPFLLVGIENTERRRDLTGPTDDPKDRAIAPRVGGSADFRSFLRGELFPEIARRYNTTGERAVVGESLAGLFVVETLFREPDLFDTYIAVDPSLWWNGGHLTKHAPELLKALNELDKTLYLTAGGHAEMAAATDRLADALLTRTAPPGLRLYHKPMPKETHRTIFHPAAGHAFRAVFSPGSLFFDGQRKKTFARLDQTIAGDRACYLDLVDEQGEPFQEMAAFEICDEPTLIGQKLRLTYGRANVIASSCMGDPECQQSESVILVEKAEVRKF